jgi:hypothetical protein
MDPDACFSQLLNHIASLEYGQAKERAQDLLDWLSRGGFGPGGGKLEQTNIAAFLVWCMSSLPTSEDSE